VDGHDAAPAPAALRRRWSRLRPARGPVAQLPTRGRDRRVAAPRPSASVSRASPSRRTPQRGAASRRAGRTPRATSSSTKRSPVAAPST
jgi:hypothetical protein